MPLRRSRPAQAASTMNALPRTGEEGAWTAAMRPNHDRGRAVAFLAVQERKEAIMCTPHRCLHKTALSRFGDHSAAIPAAPG